MANRPAARSFSALTRIDARIKVVDAGAGWCTWLDFRGPPLRET
jgi:hypothetical protein